MIDQIIRIKAFGMIAETIGKDSFELQSIQDTDELIKLLTKKHPSLKKINFAIAVDKELINKNTSLGPDSEVALLPPFSGG